MHQTKQIRSEVWYTYAEYFRIIATRNAFLLVWKQRQIPPPSFDHSSQHKDLWIYINIKMHLYVWKSHQTRFLNFVFFCSRFTTQGLLEKEVI